MRLMRSVIIAFSTYSRLPMPRVEWSEENRKYAMCFFPLIGATIGAALWLWLLVCKRLGSGTFLMGAVGAVIPLLVAGGIHMDGFMDTADALASCRPREEKLKILKDSRTGAFAVMGCAAYLLLEAAVISEAQAADGIRLGACFVASRAMSAWALTVFRPARPDGMLDTFARAAQRRWVSVSSGIWLAACLGVWSTGGILTVLSCAAVIALVTLAYRHMAYEQFGGVTGDLAGWYLQMMELCLAAVVTVGGKWL